LAASDWSAKHSIGPVNVRLLQLGRSLLWSPFCCPLMVGAVCCVCVSLSVCVCVYVCWNERIISIPLWLVSQSVADDISAAFNGVARPCAALRCAAPTALCIIYMVSSPGPSSAQASIPAWLPARPPARPPVRPSFFVLRCEWAAMRAGGCRCRCRRRGSGQSRVEKMCASRGWRRCVRGKKRGGGWAKVEAPSLGLPDLPCRTVNVEAQCSAMQRNPSSIKGWRPSINRVHVSVH
jgi:hypothetical protein